MRKAILIAFAALFMLSGCVTRRACLRKFPAQETTDSVVIVKTVEKLRDTIIYLPIPADTVFIYDTVLIDQETGQANSDTINSRLDYSQAFAWVYNSRIYLEHQQNDTLIKQIIKNAIRERIQDRETNVNKTKVERVPFLPWWAKILSYAGGVFLLMILFKIFKFLIAF